MISFMAFPVEEVKNQSLPVGVVCAHSKNSHLLQGFCFAWIKGPCEFEPHGKLNPHAGSRCCPARQLAASVMIFGSLIRADDHFVPNPAVSIPAQQFLSSLPGCRF
jgi:hypothetical protein